MILFTSRRRSLIFTKLTKVWGRVVMEFCWKSNLVSEVSWPIAGVISVSRLFDKFKSVKEVQCEVNIYLYAANINDTVQIFQLEDLTSNYLPRIGAAKECRCLDISHTKKSGSMPKRYGTEW